MEQFKENEKGFFLPFEAYYADVVKKTHDYEFINIGFFGNGTDGEFHIEWNDVGIQLHAFGDSWEALSKMPELIELMAKIDREKMEPTIHEFAEMLKRLGYKDITKRKK